MTYIYLETIGPSVTYWPHHIFLWLDPNRSEQFDLYDFSSEEHHTLANWPIFLTSPSVNGLNLWRTLQSIFFGANISKVYWIILRKNGFHVISLLLSSFWLILGSTRVRLATINPLCARFKIIQVFTWTWKWEWWYVLRKRHVFLW